MHRRTEAERLLAGEVRRSGYDIVVNTYRSDENPRGWILAGATHANDESPVDDRVEAISALLAAEIKLYPWSDQEFR